MQPYLLNYAQTISIIFFEIGANEIQPLNLFMTNAFFFPLIFIKFKLNVVIKLKKKQCACEANFNNSGRKPIK